jgi:hypothetical protein
LLAKEKTPEKSGVSLFSNMYSLQERIFRQLLQGIWNNQRFQLLIHHLQDQSS